MLHCAWKPTRHPARSSRAAVVTTIMAGSRGPTSSPKSSLISALLRAGALVAQVEIVTLGQCVRAAQAGGQGAGGRHGHGQGGAAQQGRQGEAQPVEGGGGGQLAQ